WCASAGCPGHLRRSTPRSSRPVTSPKCRRGSRSSRTRHACLKAPHWRRRPAAPGGRESMRSRCRARAWRTKPWRAARRPARSWWFPEGMTRRALFAGLATLDLVHTLERPLGPDEKTVALRQDIAAGGPAANAAVTFAALGGEAVLVTALGAHPLAGFAAAELASRAVRVLDATPEPTHPPALSP